MRAREKRKQPKEPKAKVEDKKPKLSEDEAKTRTTTAAEPAAPPPPLLSYGTYNNTLPASEKVAFDNRIKRKNVLALNEKVAALREYNRLPVYKHVGRMFNCSPDQIKRIVQQREEIMRAWEQRTRRSQDAKTMETKTVRVSMLGRAVYDWIRRMMYYKDFSISDGLIQKMALQFKSSMGLNHFFPHQEWCDKFRNTYNIQHSDTKLLKIGYTQGYSVQIKDIVKDVMSECSPEEEGQEDLEDEEEDDDVSLSSTLGSPRGPMSENEDEVDVDGGGEDDISKKQEDVKPSLSELNLQRALKPPQLTQLMRLPAPGTSQKVLLATPMTPGAQPMTMTIIPLATLSQSITQPQKNPPLAVPPPKMDIKQEKDIKTEPLDPSEEHKKSPEPEPEAAPPAVSIKQELESEDEVDLEDDNNNGRSSVTSLAEVLAANVENEKEYIEQMRQRTQDLPPLPALTKAPLPRPSGSKPPPDDNNNAAKVITSAEARKYLKLLEEFALFKENYRLIGLITRADEVLREMN